MAAYIKWIVAFVLIFIVGLPMLMTDSKGRPIMSIDDWLPGGDSVEQALDQLKDSTHRAGEGVSQLLDSPTISEDDKAASGNALSEQQLEKSPRQLSSSSGKMYKWQDEQGRWHFSSQKPLAAKSVSVEALPDVENVMEAPVTKGHKSSTIGFPDLGGAGDLLDKVQRMADDRND